MSQETIVWMSETSTRIELIDVWHYKWRQQCISSQA